ncbi:cellulose binding domain-containing protein, partial [Streptosporangium sp. NPDC023615]|uniref:cellulose binding domain-containing protein n=1 Tax=Streptosporangium sp. NPDC023615 TaxID=3154794 RepID=UPI003415547E
MDQDGVDCTGRRRSRWGGQGAGRGGAGRPGPGRVRREAVKFSRFKPVSAALVKGVTWATASVRRVRKVMTEKEGIDLPMSGLLVSGHLPPSNRIGPDMKRSRSFNRFMLTITSVVGITIPTVAVAQSAAQAAVACRVDYAVSSQWSGGFTGDVTVRNAGDAVNGWRLTWTFPEGRR